MTLQEDEPFPGLGGSADGKCDTLVQGNLELIVTASLRAHLAWGAESSLPMAHPGYQVLSDILFRLGLIANAPPPPDAVRFSRRGWSRDF